MLKGSQWDSSTRIEKKLENKNLVSWRVPHEADEEAKKTRSVTPKGSGTALCGVAIPTGKARVKNMKHALQQVLEAAKTDNCLTDEIVPLLEESLKELKHLQVNFKREHAHQARQARSKPSPKQPVLTKSKPTAPSPQGIACNHIIIPPWGRGRGIRVPGQLPYPTTPRKPKSPTTSSKGGNTPTSPPPPVAALQRDKVRSKFSWYDDEEEMDFTVPPERFCKMSVSPPKDRRPFKKLPRELPPPHLDPEAIQAASEALLAPTQKSKEEPKQQNRHVTVVGVGETSPAEKEIETDNNGEKGEKQKTDETKEKGREPADVAKKPKPAPKANAKQQRQQQLQQKKEEKLKQRQIEELKRQETAAQKEELKPKPAEKEAVSIPMEETKKEEPVQKLNKRQRNALKKAAKAEDARAKELAEVRPEVRKEEPPKQAEEVATEAPTGDTTPEVQEKEPETEAKTVVEEDSEREKAPEIETKTVKEESEKEKEPAAEVKTVEEESEKEAESKTVKEESEKEKETKTVEEESEKEPETEPVARTVEKKAEKEKELETEAKIVEEDTGNEKESEKEAETKTVEEQTGEKEPEAECIETTSSQLEKGPESNAEKTDDDTEEPPQLDESEEVLTPVFETADFSSDDEGPPKLESDFGSYDSDRDSRTAKCLSEVIMTTLSPGKQRRKNDPWVSPDKTRIDHRDIEAKQARAAARRAVLGQEKQQRHITTESKITAAKYKMELQSEKKKLGLEKRHEAAEQRAYQETRKKEEKARSSNERVGETVFLMNHHREEKAYELKQREVKKAVKDEQKVSLERDKAHAREGNYQAVMERKKKLDDEREKKQQENMKKKEEQMARADEVKRLEAVQREKKAEEYAKKVAGQKEAAQEREGEVTRKHNDKMTSSAAKLAKEKERMKAKAEREKEKYQEVLERKGTEPEPKTIKDVLKESGWEETAKNRKRIVRITLTMEKLGQGYSEKCQEAVETKSRLSRPLNKLKTILQSGRLVQSRSVLTELSNMLGVHDKAATKSHSSVRDGMTAVQQEYAYLRANHGMELLGKLLNEEYRQVKEKTGEKMQLLAPVASILSFLLTADARNTVHFVRVGGLLPVIEVVKGVLERGDMPTIFEALPLLNGVATCLESVNSDQCVADVKNVVHSHCDACGLGHLCRAILILRHPAEGQTLDLYFTCVSMLINLVAVQQNQDWLALQIEACFQLLVDLLRLRDLLKRSNAATVSPVRGYMVEDISGALELPSNEVLCVAFAVLKLLNIITRSNIELVQGKVKHDYMEFPHVVTHLIRVVCEHAGALEDLNNKATFEQQLPQAHEIRRTPMLRSVLHELLLFIGYCGMRNNETKELFRWGKTPILSLLCNLPVAYFSTSYKHVLFPTLVLLCYGEAENRTILQSEISLSSIVDFIKDKLVATPPPVTADDTTTPLQALKTMLGNNHHKQPPAYFFQLSKRIPLPDLHPAMEYFAETSSPPTDSRDNG
eukprot:TRINITY_DN17325_c0_g1_i1.p1 TRINITY_DN17325_c0_g1~~TRINITY_DN17325_c0_g1_i1.p1  ORF type:complete len:1478 (+),score=479.35 TRINITY_DN17325_c0_g1_i1:62-4495(+)